MYKLVALDMDGTLLNSEGTVSPRTNIAIKEAIKKGIIVTISTGRPIQGVKKYIKLLGIKAPVINYNGAMIVDSISKKVIYEQGLLNNEARKIIELGNKYNTTMIIWSNNRLYVNKINSSVEDYKKLSDVEPIVVTDYKEIINQGITKIIWIDEVKKIDDYKKILQNSTIENASYCTSKPIYLEFFDEKVSKAEALKILGELYNISSDEMIAIGDGENDVEMIKYVGLGIAMGNAAEVVKEEAKLITKTNDEDGIAEVLNEYFNLNE